MARRGGPSRKAITAHLSPPISAKKSGWDWLVMVKVKVGPAPLTVPFGTAAGPESNPPFWAQGALRL